MNMRKAREVVHQVHSLGLFALNGGFQRGVLPFIFIPPFGTKNFLKIFVVYYYQVSYFARDEENILGLHGFSTVRLSSLSSCFNFINNHPNPNSFDAIVIRKLSNDHVHIGSEYKKDMDILLDFDNV